MDDKMNEVSFSTISNNNFFVVFFTNWLRGFLMDERFVQEEFPVQFISQQCWRETNETNKNQTKHIMYGGFGNLITLCKETKSCRYSLWHTKVKHKKSLQKFGLIYDPFYCYGV